MNLEQKTITSVEVADMVGKEHKELLRDIRRYAKQFNESNIALVDFFEESSYKDGKDAIKKPLTALEQIALLAQGTVELEQKVETVEQKVYFIENDMPLFGAESDELSAHVKRKGVEMLGGKLYEAYRDKTLRQKVYTDIYGQLKREFGIYDDDGKAKSYKALKRKNLADAHEFVDCYTLPAYLAEQINDCNAQIRMEDGADGV